MMSGSVLHPAQARDRRTHRARLASPGFLPRTAGILLIDFYRAALSPLLIGHFGPACRFEPNCSAYARDAIDRYGLLRGGLMAARRLCRCRPAGGYGYDPVPHEYSARV